MSTQQAKDAGISESEYHEVMQDMHTELDNSRIMDTIHQKAISRLERITEGRIKLIRYE